MAFKLEKNRFGVEFTSEYDADEEGYGPEAELMQKVREGSVKMNCAVYDSEGRMISPVPERYMTPDELSVLLSQKAIYGPNKGETLDQIRAKQST